VTKVDSYWGNLEVGKVAISFDEIYSIS